MNGMLLEDAQSIVLNVAALTKPPLPRFSLYRETYKAYRQGRAETNPANGWYKGEIGFFDFYSECFTFRQGTISFPVSH
jgi:hypothetical protein